MSFTNAMVYDPMGRRAVVTQGQSTAPNLVKGQAVDTGGGSQTAYDDDELFSRLLGPSATIDASVQADILQNSHGTL